MTFYFDASYDLPPYKIVCCFPQFTVIAHARKRKET